MRTLRLILCAALLAAAAFAGRADAQDFPPPTMKIIVPFPAGGTTDILARHVAKSMHEIDLLYTLPTSHNCGGRRSSAEPL
jgi:tripartite-type tricarboxylate transporter receptor subunit TctC